MLLCDFSQTCISNVIQFTEDLKEGDPAKISQLIRHTTLSTILSYKKKYGKEYGDLVIACDGRDYWRRMEFEYYKASRKAAREASDLDWSLVFDLISEFRNDLKTFFPYKVIHVDNAEADDVIAVLTEFTQTNELIQGPLVEEPQKVLILSSDGDFKQLHKNRNVRQWSTIQKKFVVASAEGVQADYITKIVKGDKGDGIPNIYMADDFFVNGEGRQKSVTATRLAEFVERGVEACSTPAERVGYLRNEKLIGFDHIPQWVKDKIINEYLNTNPKVDRMMILAYLQKHRCRQLIGDIESF